MDRNELITPKSTQTWYSLYVFPDKLSEEVIVDKIGDERFYKEVYLKNKNSIDPDYSIVLEHSRFINEPWNINELYLIDPKSVKNQVYERLEGIDSLFLNNFPEGIHEFYKENEAICFYDCDICVG